MRKEFANTAEKSSLQTNIAEIDSAVEYALENIEVIEERNELTYDIEVEREHEFFANGILVHNCIDATRYVVMSKVLGDYASGMSAGDILDLM